MADKSILTPQNQNTEQIQPITDYLRKSNNLSEFSSEIDKEAVRANLEVPHVEDVLTKDYTYTKEETIEQINKAIDLHELENEHISEKYVQELLSDFVKKDGSTPFEARQKGVLPVEDNDLTTKKYVDNQIKELKNADSQLGQELTNTNNRFNQYVKSSDTYVKSQLYTQAEINQKLKGYVKSDGSTPFSSPQVGSDPTTDSHLATKRYVDNKMQIHLIEPDPHGFISILDSRLSQYSKKKDTYDKTQTYSRTQIDSIVNTLVENAIDNNLSDYTDSVNSKLEEIRLANYVKADGSVSFEAPISGVDAITDDQLVTYRQLKSSQSDSEILWHTSGPIESTVGHLEDNTDVPETMTLQEICDAIFYGKTISINHPDYVTIGNTMPITLCVHGSLALLDYAELYQNGQVIAMLQKDNFIDGCTTIDSLPISEDTEFIFKVYYTNDSSHEINSTVKCYLPVFVGLIPKWKPGSTITMDYLKELEEQDIEGTQNRFLKYGDNLTSITFKYEFIDPDLRQPFVVVPYSYPRLESMVTQNQSFGEEAFEIIENIPLQVEGIENEVMFTIYIYKQALSSLNQEVTFNFSKE